MDAAWLQAVQELSWDPWSAELCPRLCCHVCLGIEDASSFSFCALHKPFPFSMQQQPMVSARVPCWCDGLSLVALGSQLAAPCAHRAFASVCWAGTDLAELLQGNLEVSNQHVTGIGKTKKFCWQRLKCARDRESWIPANWERRGLRLRH